MDLWTYSIHALQIEKGKHKPVYMHYQFKIGTKVLGKLCRCQFAFLHKNYTQDYGLKVEKPLTSV